MKKSAQNETNVRPKRSAACKVQTYSMLQSGYYNEQRDLKRALKCSLIEAKAAQKDVSIKKRSFDLSIKNSLNTNNTNKNQINKDENKKQDKLISKIDNKIDNDKIIIKKFTAHRKFAQNCLPFKNNLSSIDFKESTKLSNSIYNKQPPSPPLIQNEIFSNTKLTTDDFLTFLCFREYVTLPFCLDNELNNEINSFKFETRKENTIDEKDVKETFKENSKNMKLNNNNNKTKLKQSTFNLNMKGGSDLIKNESKVNQQNSSNKINHNGNNINNINTNNKLNGNKITNNKLNNTKLNQPKLNNTKLNQPKLNTKLNQPKLQQSKLNQLKLQQSKLNQLKLQQSKVNQIKSNKLTKLAKLTKVKKEEKKQSINKQTNLKLNKNKIKIELNDLIESIKSTKQIKKKDDHKIKKESIIKETIKEINKEKIKETNKKSIKSIKSAKKQKSIDKIIKKEDPKSKKIINTRNLRSGRSMFHHYQTKN